MSRRLLPAPSPLESPASAVVPGNDPEKDDKCPQGVFSSLSIVLLMNETFYQP